MKVINSIDECGNILVSKNFVFTISMALLLGLGAWGLLQITDIKTSYASLRYVDAKRDIIEARLSKKVDAHIEVSMRRFDKVDAKFNQMQLCIETNIINLNNRFDDLHNSLSDDIQRVEDRLLDAVANNRNIPWKKSDN